MQNRLSFFAVSLCITASLLFSGCKKQEAEEPAPAANNPGGGGGGGGSTEGEGESNPGESKVRFWTTFDFFESNYCYLEFDDHSVLFDDVHNNGWTPSNCNSSESGNFTVTPGTYDYHLDSPSNGIEWNGTVTVGQDECMLVEISEAPDWWGKGKLFVYAEHLTGVDMEVRIDGIYPGIGGGGNLDEAFNDPPALYTEGTYMRYLDPGNYTLKVYDGGFPTSEFIGSVEVEINAQEVTPVALYEP